MKKIFFYVNSGPTSLAIFASKEALIPVEFIFDIKRDKCLVQVIVISFQREDGSANSFKDLELEVQKDSAPLKKGDRIKGSYNSFVGIGTFKI